MRNTEVRVVQVTKIAFIVLCLPIAHAQVRVWQDTLTLPTYEEGAPDPNPPFART